MTQVFSGIIPDPVAGTWLEITLPTPFYYTVTILWLRWMKILLVGTVRHNGAHFYSGAPADWFITMTVTILILPCHLLPILILMEHSPGAIRYNTAVGTVEGHVAEEPNCTIPIQGATITTALIPLFPMLPDITRWLYRLELIIILRSYTRMQARPFVLWYHGRKYHHRGFLPATLLCTTSKFTGQSLWPGTE